jgi:hypothetical protein
MRVHSSQGSLANLNAAAVSGAGQQQKQQPQQNFFSDPPPFIHFWTPRMSYAAVVTLTLMGEGATVSTRMQAIRDKQENYTV